MLFSYICNRVVHPVPSQIRRMTIVIRPSLVMTAVVRKSPQKNASTNRRATNQRNQNETPQRQNLVPIETLPFNLACK